MTVPSWTDAGLPERVLAEGYEQTYSDAVMSQPMEAGNFKTRLKTIMAARPVTCSIHIERPVLARLKTFFYETTKQGALPFWMPDQVFDGQPLTNAAGVVLTNAAGVPLLLSARWLMMFAGGQPPRETNPSGSIFRVNFSLVVLP